MRISRTRTLMLVATLSLGTFAFAQEQKASFGSLTGEFQSATVNSVADSGSNGDSAKAGTTYGPNDGSSVLLVMAVEGSRRIVFLGGNQAAYRTRCRSRSNFARPYICRLISFNR
jgi:hypothetical protein